MEDDTNKRIIYSLTGCIVIMNSLDSITKQQYCMIDIYLFLDKTGQRFNKL